MEEIVQRKLQQINFISVNFVRCQLTPVDCASLVTVITNVQQISHLGLAYNNFGPLGGHSDMLITALKGYFGISAVTWWVT